MNPRNINRHQSLAGRVNEREERPDGRIGARRVKEGTRAARNGVSTFVIPTALFITVARFGAL